MVVTQLSDKSQGHMPWKVDSPLEKISKSRNTRSRMNASSRLGNIYRTWILRAYPLLSAGCSVRSVTSIGHLALTTSRRLVPWSELDPGNDLLRCFNLFIDEHFYPRR